MAGSARQFSRPSGMGGKWELGMTIIQKEWQSEGMTIIRKEWHEHGKNENNPEGMTVIRKEWKFLAQMFLQLALLHPLGHKEAIGTLRYPIALKLED